MAGKKKAKGKVIDALPRGLKPSLDKPRLKDITFADLNVIARQFDKFYNQDPADFAQKCCGLCGKWGG